MKLFRCINGDLSVNSYIIGDDMFDKCYIIDSGQEPSEVIKIASSFKSVEGILLTHGHFDHSSGVEEVISKFNCKVYMNLDDMMQVDGSLANHPIMRQFLVILKCEINDIFSLQDPNITIYKTPGHTKGSVSIFFKKENILFTGDALFKDSVGRTDLPGGNSRDIYNTLKLFSSLNDDIRVLPGHGDETSIGREKKCNYYMQNI